MASAKPITILVRSMHASWLFYGRYQTVVEAEEVFEKKISKRGITAWTWIGPTPEARKMLADPKYMPPEKCTLAPCCRDASPSERAT